MTWDVVLQGSALALLAVLAWMGRRHVDRLDVIERTYLSREEHDRVIAAIRSDIQASTAGTHKRLDELLLLLAKKGKE